MVSIFQKHATPYYPPQDNIFNAFKIDPDKITVIFLGQDPYINEGEAHGFSFSVPKDKLIPPSLKNIFTEIHNEYPNTYTFAHGNLELLAYREHIFLLNTALTVKPHLSNSHTDIWKDFINEVIIHLSTTYKNKVFLLLGNNAKSKSILIDEDNGHKIICGVHPSPYSANMGFFNSGIFKKVDAALLEFGKPAINWQN